MPIFHIEFSSVFDFPNYYEYNSRSDRVIDSLVDQDAHIPGIVFAFILFLYNPVFPTSLMCNPNSNLTKSMEGRESDLLTVRCWKVAA